MIRDTCEGCKFFRPESPAGECRRHAPSVLLMPTQTGHTTIGCFPPTRPDNWCGEFQIRIAVQH
jgi:hypothetical protein